MELGWYFWALAAVIGYSWWYTAVEQNRPWAVWTWRQALKPWEWAWTRMMSHLGESPYTYQPRHKGDEDT